MKSIRLNRVIITALMGIAGIFFILPFLWMLSASFKPELEVMTYPIQWIPSTWKIVENYSQVWLGSIPFALYYLNSIEVTLLTTALSLIISAMAAYGFSKVNFKGRDVVFMLVLATYMIPHQAILVPQFIMFRWLGLFDNHLGLVLLGGSGVLGTFLLRQFFMGVHNEIIESARIDGANHWRIFFRIGLPLVKPALATYMILRFIWTWNDYQNPLIFLRTDSLFTLQLGIRKFADFNGEFYSLMMAGAVSAILPLLIIFIAGQKQVIEGVASGSVKG
ncbi:MAG: carbohydrate ABC transporter permease [Paenibacillus macerans]|uniref:ABC transporter permease subunit n=3 Tax=Paenibacillus macerans TaxID=44252 RepID=A0A090ZNQ8_PAEMA|nr:carbohydrate ABC transporter permease [Paenibacillus macerans]KFN12242.1 binding--dependent transport system inner membrane component family protein [Paenibacillus macerans]MCY7558388.1 carbohydrate ABC transporter permease [Paenibacillus macerans]MDU7473016.1 carbohydrate ABC transporter permease [Paenibacillus macerans]MEC0138927.1 carbohydrate ABC transporter permease [Paenibacillus macerans]MEC0150373.1 carbohydrate ABC transporter permease [Paenibacillus macerans]